MLATLFIAYTLQQITQPRVIPHARPQINRSRQVAPSAGALTIRTRSLKPGSIARGMQRVSMLDIDFEASCKADISLSSLSVVRRGLGSNEDIERVYLMSDGRRISTARQIGSGNGKVTFHLRDVFIPACTHTIVTVFADFSQQAAIAGEHTFTLLSEEDIESSALQTHFDYLNGLPPVYRTNTRSVGSLDVSYLTLQSPVRFGNDRIVQRFSLTADGKSSHLLQAITFTNQGSARDDDLQDIYVQSGGRRVTNIAPWMAGKLITLRFEPPLGLGKNLQRKFELKADIVAGHSKTIQLLIEEPGDIIAEPVLGRRL